MSTCCLLTSVMPESRPSTRLAKYTAGQLPAANRECAVYGKRQYFPQQGCAANHEERERDISVELNESQQMESSATSRTPTAMPSSTSDARRLELLPSSSHQTKTIDFGSSGVSASLSTSGRFLSIFRSHPVHGQIVVAPWAQFPGDQYYDIPFVRQYRELPHIGHNDQSSGFALAVKEKGDREPGSSG
jgi:hypothetical protein